MEKIFLYQIGEKKLNADNWKYSQKIDNSNFNFSDEKVLKENQYDNQINLDQFISQIRFDKKFIDSLQNDTNENNLKLSNIYFSDFDNLHLSVDKLAKVLSNNPNNEQKVNAFYKMYIIYEKEKNDKSDYYKDKIMQEFPNSVFAQKIDNVLLDNDLNDTPFILYKKYLDMFNNGQYEKLLKRYFKYRRIFKNNSIWTKIRPYKNY